jgi:subtilisin-like proprotein convertase family protein
VTIVDNESPPTLALSASTFSVEEYGGPVVVTATLALIAPTTATEVTATVNYATTNGAATSAGDYASRIGVLTFPPGTLTLTITVPITNDTTYEGNETFNIALGTPVSSTVVSPSGAVITIFDDDPRPGCTIYNSADVPRLIPDFPLGGVESTLTLPNPGVVITNTSVRIEKILHPYAPELRITLIAPDGQSVKLIDFPGVGTGPNFIHTILLDGAPPLGGASPLTGNFRPDNPLSSLNGTASGGIWKLRITDAESGAAGTLEAWGLEICGGATAPTSYLYLPLVLR